MALSAGVVSVDVTPPVGVELCGYGFYLERASTGVRDRLKARALVLDDGSTQIAIVSCDLVGLMPKTVAEARAVIADSTGIPGDSVMFACSHTHAGPATIDIRGCGVVDWDYVATLPGLLADAVIQAHAALEPAQLGAGGTDAPGLGFNRVEGDTGPLDTGMVIIRVDRPDGAPLATVFNVTAHAVTNFHLNTLVSADWPGAAARQIAEEIGGEALFLQGSCGDVNPVLNHTGEPEEAAKIASAAVRSTRGGIAYMEAPSLAASSALVELPLDVIAPLELEATVAATQEAANQDPSARMSLGAAKHLLEVHEQGAPQALQTEIQAFRIGDALVLAHGSELFCEFGLELKEQFAPRHVLVAGYVNDFIGYVPDPEDFERGGYAAATVPQMCGNFPFTRDVGTRLADELSRLASGIV